MIVSICLIKYLIYCANQRQNACEYSQEKFKIN